MAALGNGTYSHTITPPNNGITYSLGSVSLDYSPETAKDLRKRARKVEKTEQKRKAKAKAAKALKKRKAADRETCRKALLATAADFTKGYARVEAVRALNELELI